MEVGDNCNDRRSAENDNVVRICTDSYFWHESSSTHYCNYSSFKGKKAAVVANEAAERAKKSNCSNALYFIC